jgi:hypothetical protein
MRTDRQAGRQTDRQTGRQTETDRHDEASSRFSQFCERAPKNGCAEREGYVTHTEGYNNMKVMTI